MDDDPNDLQYNCSSMNGPGMSATCGRLGVPSQCGAAAIWGNDFGLELRVLHREELVDSRLSRVGEAPLRLIADQMKANLIAQGWTEPPNGT